MTTNYTRMLDGQGRVIIPPHFREILNLHGGSQVELELEADGTIRIRPAELRCCLCGEPVEETRYTEISKEPNRKAVCIGCSKKIIREMTRR